jgi:hypothetical protein
MGGLISIYAICEYPKSFEVQLVYRLAWDFSTENNPVPDSFVGYLKQNQIQKKTHKIYFDYEIKL